MKRALSVSHSIWSQLPCQYFHNVSRKLPVQSWVRLFAMFPRFSHAKSHSGFCSSISLLTPHTLFHFEMPQCVRNAGILVRGFLFRMSLHVALATLLAYVKCVESCMYFAYVNCLPSAGDRRPCLFCQRDHDHENRNTTHTEASRNGRPTTNGWIRLLLLHVGQSNSTQWK